MKRRFLVLSFATLWIMTNASFAWALCLNGHPTVEQEFKSVKYVVIAEVAAERRIRDAPDGYYLEGTNYKIDIEETLKGPRVPAITVFSENSSARFWMSRGVAYLLFIDEVHHRFVVDNCGNSAPIEDAQDSLAAVRRLTTGSLR